MSPAPNPEPRTTVILLDVVLLLSVCLISGGCATSAPSTPPATTSLNRVDLLTRIQRSAFDYLVKARDPQTGLVYNTTESNAPASPTAGGVALCAIPVGIEQGWISRSQGYDDAKRLLHAYLRAEHHHGFFYHFLDPRTGRRTWHSEVSCIDSAILFAGAMVVGRYFQGTEVDTLAERLIDRAEWPWFLDGEDTLKWAWTPEQGFQGGSMDYSESILAYLIAMGSSSHPIPSDCWQAMRRPIALAFGSQRRMVYTSDGSLFAYLLPLIWFDLRDQHDDFLDYWTNAQTAIESNRAFCQAQRDRFATYRAGLWGVSAALGPDGYQAYGTPPAARFVHDGTVAPYVVATALAWLPEQALATLQQMEAMAPHLWTRYGFGNSINRDRQFVSLHTIALDQSMGLLMIENVRSGLIWRLMNQHPVAQRGMRAAGFMPGSLEEPIPPAVIAGNPGAKLSVPKLTQPIQIDGELSEWSQQGTFELSPQDRRNVEFGFFRGSQDASARIAVGWDGAALYVAGQVMDDELVTRRQGEAIYQDDCLELFADLDGDGFRFDGNARDLQIGLAPNTLQGSWQLWAWGALKREPPEIDAAVKLQNDGFVFELRIPRPLLQDLEPGQPMRFSVAYHDRDRDGKAGKLHWSVDATSQPNTLLFGQMTLVNPSTPPAGDRSGFRPAGAP